MSAWRRVLLVRRGGLGDSLCFLPVVEAARRTWRDAEVVFAGTSDVAELFVARGAADRGTSVETLELWGLDGTPQSRARCLERLAGFDHLVGEIDAAALPPELRARATAFDVVVDEKGDERAAAQVAARARRVWPEPWPEVEAVPRLLASRVAIEAGHVWIHPGAGSPRKCWPGWLGVVQAIAGRGGRCTVSFGEADVELRARLEPELPAAVRVFADRLLPELAASLERATAYAGNDSGVSHLAAALGVPSVVLFGPTRPTVWAPHGARVLTFAARAAEVLQRLVEIH